MNEIKSTQRPHKKSTQKEKSEDVKEISIMGAKIFGGLLIFGAISFGAYKVLVKEPPPIWKNYDEIVSTGEKILHQQTISIKNISSDSPTKNSVEDVMYLSIKKIDNNDAVWFIGTTNDFGCVSTVSEKCSLEISIDGKPAKKYTYDGGTLKTAYMIDAKGLIKEIKKAKELKLSSTFKRPEMSPTEKSNLAMANGGRYVDRFQKEHTFTVQGLIWD